ncbi:MAG TPA: LLM class flavin-dependent oxidoreductase, partial [Stellaceae bacterium]|nr:LLM class flavin-dependent oxidoreductase [Stellaceae bacterium]
ILLGGESDHTLRRVVEYCDGWFPRPQRGWDIRHERDRLRKMAEEHGRDFNSLFISVFRAPPDAAALADYREAGIQEALLEIPDASRDEILKVLDRYAPLLK